MKTIRIRLAKNGTTEDHILGLENGVLHSWDGHGWTRRRALKAKTPQEMTRKVRAIYAGQGVKVRLLRGSSEGW